MIRNPRAALNFAAVRRAALLAAVAALAVH